MVKDPLTRRSFYRGFFSNYVMPKLFLSLSPQIRILYESFVTIDQQEFFFSVLEMAEAQTFVEQSQGNLDYVIRGVLIFIEGHSIYMLSDQYAFPSLISREWSPPSAKQIDSRIQALKIFYERITFK